MAQDRILKALEWYLDFLLAHLLVVFPLNEFEWNFVRYSDDRCSSHQADIPNFKPSFYFLHLIV